MHTKIKICGIKTIEEVAIMNQYPVDYVGFIFAKSKRQITKDKVLTLKSQLKDNIQTVGVFVNETIENVNTMIEACNLQIVQLHGDETVDYCKQIKAKVWKSISIKDENSLDTIKDYEAVVDGILLDTYYKGETGGTGKTFDWQGISTSLKDLDFKCKVIIAGGLSADNVKTAIEVFNPYALDLNSKLETNLIKDKEKVKAVFENLKQL